MGWWIIFSLVFIVLCFVVVGFCFTFENKQKKRFAENIHAIRPGMLKSDVINLMGKKYSHSYLQNDIEKLEWHYCESGGGVKMSGVFVFNAGKTKSICVVFQHGTVIEVYTQ